MHNFKLFMGHGKKLSWKAFISINLFFVFYYCSKYRINISKILTEIGDDNDVVARDIYLMLTQ